MNCSALTKWLLMVGSLLVQRSTPAGAAFEFTLNILSSSTSGCRSDICESHYSNFCLRGPGSPPSPDTSDCSLGSSSEVLMLTGTTTISSDKTWPVRVLSEALIDTCMCTFTRLHRYVMWHELYLAGDFGVRVGSLLSIHHPYVCPLLNKIANLCVCTHHSSSYVLLILMYT